MAQGTRTASGIQPDAVGPDARRRVARGRRHATPTTRPLGRDRAPFPGIPPVAPAAPEDQAAWAGGDIRKGRMAPWCQSGVCRPRLAGSAL